MRRSEIEMDRRPCADAVSQRRPERSDPSDDESSSQDDQHREWSGNWRKGPCDNRRQQPAQHAGQRDAKSCGTDNRSSRRHGLMSNADPPAPPRQTHATTRFQTTLMIAGPEWTDMSTFFTGVGGPRPPRRLGGRFDVRVTARLTNGCGTASGRRLALEARRQDARRSEGKGRSSSTRRITRWADAARERRLRCEASAQRKWARPDAPLPR